MAKRDFYVGIFLLIGCALAYWEASSYPLGSAYFPRIIIGLLAALSLAMAGKVLWAGKKESAPAQQTPAVSKPLFWKNEAFRKVIWMIGLSVVYLLVLDDLGFFLSTSIYLVVMIRLLGVKKVKMIFLSTFIVLFFIYLVFAAFLKVPIPRGIFF